MLQLKPGLRRPTFRKGPATTLYDMDFFYHIGKPYRIEHASKFPFRETIPLYLKSQLRGGEKPRNYQFLVHNLNKRLNRYCGSKKVDYLKKHYKDAWKMEGLRDIVMDFRKTDEVHMLKDYWAHKLPKYFDKVMISRYSDRYPRLKEFVKKRRKGYVGRAEYFKNMVSNWPHYPKKNPKDKLLYKQFKNELDLIKNHFRDLNVLVQCNIGNKKYNEMRMSNLRRATAMLNIFHNVFGMNLDSKVVEMMKKDQRKFKKTKRDKGKRMLTLVIRTEPSFDERRALQSICKRHFNEIYRPPNLPVVEKKILTRENFMQKNKAKIRRKINVPAKRLSIHQYAFKGKFFVKADLDDELLEGIKQRLREKGIEKDTNETELVHSFNKDVKKEIIPHYLPKYEALVHKSQRQKRIEGFFKFFKDFEGIFRASGTEAVYVPPEELKPAVSVTDFVKKKEYRKIEALETTASSVLVIPGDSSDGEKEEEEEEGESKTIGDDREGATDDQRLSSFVADDDEVIKHKTTEKLDDIVKRGKWSVMSVKKANYIILRYLHGMSKQRQIPEKVIAEDTLSEHSSHYPPSSDDLQLPPLFALKKLLTEEIKEKAYKSPLKHLEKYAKDMYNKIKKNKKIDLISKCRTFQEHFAKESGIPDTGRNNSVDELLDKWESEDLLDVTRDLRNVSSLSTLYTESDESAMYDVKPTIFEFAGHPLQQDETALFEVLSLLIFFLSFANKIIRVRRALKRFKEQKDLKRYMKLKVKEEKLKSKRRKEKKTVSLPHFREFLEKYYGLLESKEYLAIAERYCPDYEFYERKKDLLKPVAPARVASGEEIGLPLVQAPDVKPTVLKKESDHSEVTDEVEAEETEELTEDKKSRKEFSEKSYISWKGPPCEDDFSRKIRVYSMKHSTEWAPFPDYSDFKIDKKNISSDFFEFPTSLCIPKLVTNYYRHLPALKLPKSYILDPTPDVFKWKKSCWRETKTTLDYFEEYDQDLPWMIKHYHLFWLAEKKTEYTTQEIRNIIFSSWSGNLNTSDHTYKFFDRLCEAIDNFEKESKPTIKKIYDLEKTGEQKWEWLNVNSYLENKSPKDLLWIHKWVRDLNRQYNEHVFEDSRTSVTHRSYSSVHQGMSFRGSMMEGERSREKDKVEETSGFPLKDFKSLKEVLVSFIETVKLFRSYRLSPFGDNYRPITEYYLKCITEECGFVETNDDPHNHPNIRLAPSKAICYSDKEKQFYYHSNNFIDILQKRYPQRFMKMPYHVRNEYGSMKHVCTFISTRRLSFPELNTWKGCMRAVANKLECERLEDAHRPPRMMKSPYTTLQDRKGNVFELSILLTGFLIAAGYDAYCVCGTATYHRSFYGNTDDVSPDESDVEPPSVNRYEQYNLLPPFSSRWFRDSTAYYDPIPYEEMEVCRVNREKKKLFMEEYSTWPKTDRDVLAEYDKKIEDKVGHKSRFDNPAIALPTGHKKTVETEIGETEGEKMAIKKLDDLYEKLIAERGQREEEEKRKEEAKKKLMRTYIHETPKEPKSSFEENRIKLERIEMAKSRQEKNKKKRSKRDAKYFEEVKYYEWLYSSEGPYPEYAQMLKKEKERTTRDPELPEINLLQFTEFYDPKQHRLEVVTGERLHYYDRDSMRCKKKLQKMSDDTWFLDRYRLERVVARRAHYRKADGLDQAKRKREEPASETTSESSLAKRAKVRKTRRKGRVHKRSVTAKEIIINPTVNAISHRAKLLSSPFIRKLWLNLSKELPFIKIKRLETVPKLSTKKLRRERHQDIKVEDFSSVIKLLEGTYFLKHLNPATLEFIEPILQKSNNLEEEARRKSLLVARSKHAVRRKVKKSREKKLLNKKPYVPSRIHCWVLVRSGTRNVNKPFFIDVFTGVSYPATDFNYLKISCVWNNKNYYVPRYVATYHKKTREFELKDNAYWFHLLPLEPMTDVVEKRRKPWWWDIKGHPHVLQHIEMPPYWGRRVRMPALEWDKMFPNTNKKTFYYKRAIIEVYDRDGRPADGLVKRISRYLDMKRTILESVDTKYETRKDGLMWRHFHINSGFVEERFQEGRPDHLKCYRFLAYLLPGLYTPKEFQFYGKRRDDKLSNLLISNKGMVAEFKEGRMDHLKRVKYSYSRHKTDKRLMVIDEYSRCVKRVCARFRRLSFQFEPWKQFFKEFSEIPIKLEINMNYMFSEYWYWDEKLESPVKWVSEHIDEDRDAFVKSKKLRTNSFLDTEPILYGVGRTLEDTPSQLMKRKERYAKRESDDRVYLVTEARKLEQVVCDTIILREYEKIMDVLKGADEMKRLNITSEKALDTMKTYFEAEREMLNRDFQETVSKKSLDDIWNSDKNNLPQKLLYYFIKEKFWIHFMIGSWDKMNEMFTKIIEERKKGSPLFVGYTDLLRSLVLAFSHGFGRTKNTFPGETKCTQDLLGIQVDVPMRMAQKQKTALKRELLDLSSDEEERKSENGVVINDNCAELKQNNRKINDEVSQETMTLGSSSTLRSKQNEKNNNKKSNKQCETKSASLKETSDISAIDSVSKEKLTKVFPEDNYKTIDLENSYLLKNLMMQVVQFLTPKEYHALFKVRTSPNIGWSNHFVELFNSFVNEIASTGDTKTEEGQEILELVDYQHPYRAHIRHHEDVLSILKKLVPSRGLSTSEQDQIIAIYNRRREEGRFEEEDINDILNILSQRKDYRDLNPMDIQEFLVGFINKKRAKLFEKPRPNKILPKKTKIKKKPFELNFTFENVPEINKRNNPKIITHDDNVDHYKLFVHKYKNVSNSVKGLKAFLSEIRYRPAHSQILQKKLDQFMPTHEFSFQLLTKKERPQVKPVKAKPQLTFDGQDDRKLQYCYIDDHYNYNNKFYMYGNIWREDWMDANVVTGSLPVKTTDLTAKRNTDVGVIDVIHLFSKPSELQFVERKNEKVFILKPVLTKEEIQIFNFDEMEKLFPLDYSYLELCEEPVTKVVKNLSGDLDSDLDKSTGMEDKDIEYRLVKLHKKEGSSVKSKIKKPCKNSREPLRKIPLDVSIKSCPHCVNIYYQTNRERLKLLDFIEVKRDMHAAFCMARPNKNPHPQNVLEEHRKKIEFYEKYIEYLQDESTVYNSCGLKIISDECRQFKYFLELLNYKIIYDYFPVNVLYRKFRYETRPWTIYPEDFEFTDTKLYEKFMTSDKDKPMILKQEPKKLPGNPFEAVEDILPFHFTKRVEPEVFELSSIEEIATMPGDILSDEDRIERLKEKKTISKLPEIKKYYAPSGTVKRKKKNAYPEVDVNNTIQVELYRDIRPKREHRRPHLGFKQTSIKKGHEKTATTLVTKKIWK